MSFAYEVRVGSDPKFYSNAVRFATEDEAKRAGEDKKMAWTSVIEVRVVESTDPVNYAYTESGKLVHLDKPGAF